jgi:hypothetical protein
VNVYLYLLFDIVFVENKAEFGSGQAEAGGGNQVT